VLAGGEIDLADLSAERCESVGGREHRRAHPRIAALELEEVANNPAVKSSAGRSTDVASISSLPHIAFSDIAHSSTVFENGPIWSSEEANATMPNRDTRP
jgi:hypothetical protein